MAKARNAAPTGLAEVENASATPDSPSAEETQTPSGFTALTRILYGEPVDPNALEKGAIVHTIEPGDLIPAKFLDGIRKSGLVEGQQFEAK